MLDLRLLNYALDRIAREPQRWNQNSWVANDNVWGANRQAMYDTNPAEICGTQMCLAGHTLLATGDYVLAWKKYEPDTYNDKGKYLWFFNTIEGEWAPSADKDAARALGLDPEDDDDANLICRLFLTTGFAHSEDSFIEYKHHVQNALNDYFVAKIATLESRLENALAPEVKDLPSGVTGDPWADYKGPFNDDATLSPLDNDEPPF